MGKDFEGKVDHKVAFVLDPERQLADDAFHGDGARVLDLVSLEKLGEALEKGVPGVVVLPLATKDEAINPDSPLGKFLRQHDADVRVIFYGKAPDVLTETQLALALKAHEVIYGEGEPLNRALKEAVERQRAARATQLTQLERVKKFLADNGVVAYSSQALRVYRDIESVAIAGTGTVHITGESGTGKEKAAQLIHAQGPNSQSPFVARSIADIPPTLIESELFGHVKGAFTGATENRDGLFKRADGGTLFLDEIAELPKELQAKLLRVVQEGEFTPVGGTKPIKVKVRLITGTKENLPKMVEEGKFREDLFFRLTQWHVGLPAFRDRPDDIAPLFHAFVRKLGRDGIGPAGEMKVNRSVYQLLTVLPLPGNARELENIARAALLNAKTEGATELQVRHIPMAQLEQGLRALQSRPQPPEIRWLDEPTAAAPPLAEAAPALVAPHSVSPSKQLESVLEAEERRRILEALESTKTSRGWNRVRAAGQLGMGQVELKRAMERLGLLELH